MAHICHWSTREAEPHDQPGSRANLATEWDPNSKEKKNQNKSLSKPRPKFASILLSLSNQAVFVLLKIKSHSRTQQSKLAWNSRSSSSTHQALSCRHGHNTCSKTAHCNGLFPTIGASFCRSANAASTTSLWHARPTMPSGPGASSPDRSRCWFWRCPCPLHIPLWSLRGETGDLQLVCHCLWLVSIREHSLLLAFGCLKKSSVLVKYLKRTIKMVEGFMQNVWILSWGIWSGKEQKLFFFYLGYGS